MLDRPRYQAYRGAVIAAAAAVVTALFFQLSRAGDGLARLSFDLPFFFRALPPRDDVVVVKMDEQAYRDLGQEYPKFDRAIHADFLNKLQDAGAKLVVFDVFFPDPSFSDPLLACAIYAHGNVVLGYQLEKSGHPMFPGKRRMLPTDELADLKGCAYALLGLQRDPDQIVRRVPPSHPDPCLASAAARAYGASLSAELEKRSGLWITYYRPTQPSQLFSYSAALGMAPSFFRNKVVWIGGKPEVPHVGETSDIFETPLTRWHGSILSGVEVHATIFQNLVHNEYSTRLGAAGEILLIIAAGLIGGFLFVRFKPPLGFAVAFLAAFLVAVASIALFWSARIWLNWSVIALVEIPVAWAAAALVYTRQLAREKDEFERQATAAKRTASATAPPVIIYEPADANQIAHLDDGKPVIPDFRLVKQIGEGAFGVVWLAQSIPGAYRAIKIVYRKNFEDDRPFDREFEGVRTFAATPRTHPGCVNILHVGLSAKREFFYYVMEAADDLFTGQNFDPDSYVPKTLGKVLVERGWLGIEECIDLGMALSEALEALHQRGLIHRDIKPSNIIFVDDQPKFADIGLVALIGRGSFVGTENFIPPEGPGGLKADIYSLGKVLYQAATGLPPQRFPSLPDELLDRPDSRAMMKLMDVINKACSAFHGDRYDSAAELHAALKKLKPALDRRVAR